MFFKQADYFRKQYFQAEIIVLQIQEEIITRACSSKYVRDFEEIWLKV